MEDENKTLRNDEIIVKIKDDIKKQLKDLFENIPYLLGQINEFMNYSNETTVKRTENFFLKILKELCEINQKLLNFNISKFEKSYFGQMDNSYSHSNKSSDNNSLNNDNYLSKSKELYKSYYESFEKKSDYYSTPNKINFNIDNNNSQKNHSNNLYNSSLLFNFNEKVAQSFIETIINIFNNFNIFIYSSKIKEEDFTGFLEVINKFIMKYESKCNENDNSFINSSIEEIDNSIDSNLSTEYKAIYIKSVEELENNRGNSSLMVSIRLNDQKNFPSLSIFNQMKLDNLKILELKGNKIIDISPLLNLNLYFLETLDLEDNELDNQCVDVLNKIKLNNLIWLNLYINKITTIIFYEIMLASIFVPIFKKVPTWSHFISHPVIKIFEIIENFKTLKNLFLGNNPFSEDEIKNNNKKYIFPCALNELGITGNFNNESIHFIKYLNLENIKVIYLSRNNLTSLECLKNCYFYQLEQFWAADNLITDINEIKYLKNKKTIEKINLSGNKISVIKDKFLKLLNQFPNLKLINLKNNQIDENKEIIKKIKNKVKIFN